MDGCRVEAVVGLDARGQMVLPKDVRERAGFGPDEKLAVVSWERGGQVCCVSLQRAEDLAEAVRRRYGPVLSGARAG
jgi:antitoxin PrlF